MGDSKIKINIFSSFIVQYMYIVVYNLYRLHYVHVYNVIAVIVQIVIIM